MTEVRWMQRFSQTLNSMMREQGLSQRELARLSGISQATINRYLNEMQMPSIKAILNLAYALDCEFDELMDFGDRID